MPIGPNVPAQQVFASETPARRRRFVKPQITRIEMVPLTLDSTVVASEKTDLVRVDISMSLIMDRRTASTMNINPRMLQELFAHADHPDQMNCVECTAEALGAEPSPVVNVREVQP